MCYLARLVLLACAASLAFWGPPSAAAKSSKSAAKGTTVPAEMADLILHNGKIVTVDRRFTIAQAVAIRGDRILAVGTQQKMLALAGPRTRRIDLKGKTVIPGLIDTHNHMLMTGLNSLKVQTAQARSVADLVQAIKAAAENTPAGQWIVPASDWRDTLLVEKRMPNRWELDQATTAHPVYLPMGGHIAIVNSHAMKLAGITRQTPDPPGSHLDRDSNGEPNGVLRERPALGLVQRLLPRVSAKDRIQALRTIQPLYHAAGLTSIIDPGVAIEDVEAYQEVWAQGQLTVRSALYVRPNAALPVERIVASLRGLGLAADFGNDQLRVAGIKFTVDGGISIGTALLREAYPKRPDYHGVQVIPTPQVQAIAVEAGRNHWRVHAHAAGDAAIDRVLEAYAKAHEQRSIAERRFTLEHASLTRPDQYETMKRLGLLLSITTVHPYNKSSAIVRDLGAARAERVGPVKDLIDHGVRVAAGSDSPINAFAPLLGIGFSVTRKTVEGEIFGKDQRLPVETALRLYTLWAADFTFEEKVKGSIEPGKWADLVVLSGDLLKVAPEMIPSLEVLLTMVGGKTVYERAEASAAR